MSPLATQERAVDVDLEQALRGAMAGDEASFLVLWRALQPRLLRFLRVYGGDGHEDVAADTWLQVVRDLGGFRGDADDFRGWLFTIARHRAIDAGRSRARRPLLLVGDARELPTQTAASSAEDHALARLSTDEALAQVRRLPPAQAELVALRILADLDVSTVAEIVGSTPGAVRVAVHRALKTLAVQANPTPLESL
jgi:RNA polymerase sigma-70 factor (ECF subfamily)